MRLLVVALIMFGIVQATPSTAYADGIKVENPWARASAGAARAGAAYMALVNNGDAADTLINVKSDVSKRTEIHTHMMDGGVMRMRQIEGIEVPAGEPVVLQPGGLHIMFMGLHAPFKEGDAFPLTLVFEHAGEIEVNVSIKGVGAKDSGHGSHKHGSGHTH